GTATHRGDAPRPRTSWLAAAALAAALLPAAAAVAADGTWTQAAGGSYPWSDPANWSGGIVADGANSTANFTTGLTGGVNVNLDTPRTIGSLVFDNPASAFGWSVSGTNALTLSNASGPSIAVNNAAITATLTAPLAGTQGFTKA